MPASVPASASSLPAVVPEPVVGLVLLGLCGLLHFLCYLFLSLQHLVRLQVKRPKQWPTECLILEVLL